jgi:hypothetical protein
VLAGGQFLLAGNRRAFDADEVVIEDGLALDEAEP